MEQIYTEEDAGAKQKLLRAVSQRDSRHTAVEVGQVPRAMDLSALNSQLSTHLPSPPPPQF